MVAQERHFSRAADRLHLAQSALSAQVKRLEADLGVRLFDRGKRAAVALTPAGLIFLEEAWAVLRQVERAQRVGGMAGRGEVGEIAIGYVVSAAMCGLLPDVLGQFRRTHSAVTMRVETMQTPRQLDAIVDGQIDVGFIRPRERYPEGVAGRIVHREKLVLALPCDHRLAGAPIEPKGLAGETFIIPQFDDVSGFASELAALSTLVEHLIEDPVRVGDFVTALSMAAAGHGLALVPNSIQAIRMSGLTFQPVVDFEVQVELAVAWRIRDRNPVTKAFIGSMAEDIKWG